jgi:hypothetical protein
VDRPVARRPFHVPVRGREEDRAHDPPVDERIAVAVLEVGHGLIACVRDERDRTRRGQDDRRVPRKLGAERLPEAAALARHANRA